MDINIAKRIKTFSIIALVIIVINLIITLSNHDLYFALISNVRLFDEGITYNLYFIIVKIFFYIMIVYGVFFASYIVYQSRKLLKYGS